MCYFKDNKILLITLIKMFKFRSIENAISTPIIILFSDKKNLDTYICACVCTHTYIYFWVPSSWARSLKQYIKNKTTLALNKAEWSLEKRAKNMQLRTSEIACNGVAKVLMATNPPNNSSNPGKRTTKLFPLSLEYCIGFEFQISYIIWIESVGWTH